VVHGRRDLAKEKTTDDPDGDTKQNLKRAGDPDGGKEKVGADERPEPFWFRHFAPTLVVGASDLNL